MSSALTQIAMTFTFGGSNEDRTLFQHCSKAQQNQGWQRRAYA